MATKLNEANLGKLPAEVRVPSYDRKRIGQSIVHIGVGGFYRAHQAVYAEDLFEQRGPSEWGFTGVGLLEHDARIRDVLREQDCLYTVVERGLGGEKARIIGALKRFVFAPTETQDVLETMASPDCRIVSLTITEGGYYVNQGTGEFDDTHPDIQRELANPEKPRCSFGYLAKALELRRSRNLGPFTLMSCDNLQSNGDVLKKMFLSFAELRDPELHNWLTKNAAFPNSMVDRITPATTDEHRELVREQFGIDDGWPVMTEPFRQWVIEDHFVSGRPAWQEVGAQMTSDVLPYEKMKIRLLNASHQAMCYIGMLLGYTFAHEAMADDQIRELVRGMMDDEVTALLPEVPGVNLGEYKKTLIERFTNPAIRDQLSRIGTEGSARIPKFVLPSIIEALDRNGPIRKLSFTVASWFRYLKGTDDQGKTLPIIDPMESRLREHAQAAGDRPDKFFEMRDLFGDRLPADQRFHKEVSGILRDFYQLGARKTLEKALAAKT
jgi:mannitol 2-dehydrogenase